MPITVANTANTNTWYYLVTRVNELAYAVSTYAVTVDSNAAVGNASISGHVFATGLRVNTISGGNSGVSNSLYLTSNLSVNTSYIISIGSSTLNSTSYSIGNSVVKSTYVGATTVNTNSVVVGADLVINTSTIFVGNASSNVVITPTGISINGETVGTGSLSINARSTGTSEQIIDTLDKSLFAGAEYVLTVTDNTNLYNKQIVKILMVHDTSTNVFITEHGVCFSNTDLGSFTANANSTHCRLLLTPTSSNCQIKGYRVNIVI